MKRLFKAFFLVALALLLSVSANATNYDYTASVYKQTADTVGDSNPTLISTGIAFKVLTINTDTAATLTVFGDSGATSLNNPVTTTAFAATTLNKVKFRTTASTVDLLVTDTNGGYSTVIEGFSPSMHKIVIDQRANVMHHGLIWFGASDAAETDTGVDFNYDTYVHDVRVETVTVDAGETLNVGLLSTETSGDADGLSLLVAVSTAGYPTDTAVITGGSNIDYVPVTTYGALLVTAVTGSDAVVSNGGCSYIGHIVTGANAQSITYTGSAGSDTAAGYIHYFFTKLR